MPEIPRAVCACCMVSMHPKKNGVVLQALNKGQPYYKAEADEWGCSSCGNSIYTGFGQKPIVVKHETGYDRVKFDGSFELGE